MHRKRGGHTEYQNIKISKPQTGVVQFTVVGSQKFHSPPDGRWVNLGETREWGVLPYRGDNKSGNTVT